VPALSGRRAPPAYGHAEGGPVRPVHYDGGTIPPDHYPVRAEIHY